VIRLTCPEKRNARNARNEQLGARNARNEQLVQQIGAFFADPPSGIRAAACSPRVITSAPGSTRRTQPAQPAHPS